MGVQREDVKQFIDRIRVSGDDVSALFLSDKLKAGSNMSFNVLDAGGSEVLELDAAVSDDVNPVDVSDDGTSVVTDADLINFAGGFFTVTNPTGSDVKVIITADAITANELDLSMSPVWTGTHEFDGGIIVPTGTSVSPTTEGQLAWDSDDDLLKVGTGGSTVTVSGASDLRDLNDTNIASDANLDRGDLLIWDSNNNEWNDGVLTEDISTGITTLQDDASIELSLDWTLAGNLNSDAASDDLLMVADVSDNDTHKRMQVSQLAGGIPHDDLSGFVSDEHVDHSTVNISTGAGLSGGGDITADRTVAMAINNMTSLGTAPADADQIPIYDSSSGSHKEVSVSELGNAIGGSDAVDVEDDGTSIVTDASIIDFADGEFDVTNPTGSEVQVILTTSGVDNSKLSNDSVTVAGNSVSLGGSTAVAIPDLSDTNFGTRSAGQLMIWDDTNNEWVDATLTAGNATTITNADGSITIAVDASALAGTLLTSSSGSLDVDESSIDHDVLTNFVANEHVDHSNVSISGGTGISGGGDITSSRTLALAIGTLTSLGSAPASDDLIAIRDTSAGDHKEISISELDNAITDTDTRVDVEDSGTSVVTDSDAINFGSNLDVTDDGDNSVTVDAQSATDTRVDVEDDGVSIATDASIIDFKNGYFDVTNPTGSEVDVSLTDASIENAKLVNSSVTIAGNSVSLGGSTTLDSSDLSDVSVTSPSDGEALIYVGGNSQFENTALTASNIGDVSADSVSDAHHNRYTDEEAQDAVGTITSGGDKITVTYDDANNTITIDTSALDAEEVQDEVNTVLSGGDKISTTYDDANDTLTINTTALDAEEVEDQVNSLLTGGTNVSLTYDDANDTLTIDATDTTRSDEEIEDVVNALLTGGTNVSLTYDDANDTLTIDASQKTTEEVQDDVGTILQSPLNYDDGNDLIDLDLNGLTSATISSNDVLHIEDADDNNNPKKVTAQDVADLNSNQQHRNEVMAFVF